MSDTAPGTAAANEMEAVLNQLRSVADAIAAKCPQVSDAALALITGTRYDDRTLVASSHVSLLSALADLANDLIARELEASSGLQAGLKEMWQKYIDNKAIELAAFENLKDAIESLIEERITSMQKGRKLVRGP